MKNFIQDGDTVSVPAPYDVNSGDGALVGSLFGVAVTDALTGAHVQLKTCGVVTLPKTTGQAWTVGARLYWNDTTRKCSTAATGNTLVGVALAAAASGDESGAVRLNASF
jgi:predicted RecA/RadA family phage recombinase